MSTLERAIEIAARAHAGQIDKANQPYILHPLRVMLSVNTQSGCPWTAGSNASWIGITSGASGSGSGSVRYTVASNNTGNDRTGTLTIAGQTFTVMQKK